MSVPGQVITFYSYKGGTGRTMALANVGVELARRGPGRVLMVDWDLEAPGLHDFFPEVARSPAAGGVLDLFESIEGRLDDDPRQLDEDPAAFWSDVRLDDYIVETDEPALHLIRAKSPGDETYATRVSRFSWEALYTRAPGLFRAFADQLGSRYRYILIDSRTGLTDSGGVCTTLLPERLVVVFTPNRQSLTGVVDLVRTATAYRSESPDLRPLLVFPLASRVEMSEDEMRRHWRYGSDGTPGYQSEFEQLFKSVYDLPSCDLENYFDEIQVQHATRYAYGERVAVRDEPSDRLSLSRSYQRFTRALLDDEGPWAFKYAPTVQADGGEWSEKLRGRLKVARDYHYRQAVRMERRNRLITAIEIAGVLAVLLLIAAIWANAASGYERYWLPEAIEQTVPALVIGGAVFAVFEWLKHAFAPGSRCAIHIRAGRALDSELARFEARAGPYRDTEDPVALLTERTEVILASAEEGLLDPRRATSGPPE